MMKNNVLIFADHIVFPKGEIREGPFYVVAKNGKITKISKAESSMNSVAQCERCDAVPCHLLAPGFVDIHNYGLGGSDDILDYWKKPEYTCAKAVTTGTTSLLASVVFPEERDEETRSLLKKITSRIGDKVAGAVIEGVRAEGPLIADFGGLPKSSTEYGENEFGSLLDSMTQLKIMTISPSVASQLNYEPIKMIRQRNVLPSLGYDREADEEAILDALSMCKDQQCHITHLFNVSTFHHRNPGLVNFGLLDNYPSQAKYAGIIPPTVEIIGDMIHVHPFAVKLVLNSRNWRNIAFVTSGVGYRSQLQETIKYGGQDVKVEDDVVKRCDDDTIVGSCCSMLDIFTSLTKNFDVSIGKACMMLSENPARIAKLDNVGTIEVGKDANFIMFDHNYNLTKTFVDGRMVFRTTSCKKKSVISTESIEKSVHLIM